MKIAFICTEKLPVPAISGGAIQQYIDGISPYLSGQYKITIFSLAHPSLPNKEKKDNLKYKRVSGKNAEEYINNVMALLTDKYELVHIFNRPLWVPLIRQKLERAKISLSLHNEMFSPEKIPHEKAVECIKNVEFITTVSQFIADGIRKLYPIADKKLNVVYSGVDVDKYQPSWSKQGIENKNSLKSKLGITKDKMILYVSRLSPKKGSDIVLKAVKAVMESRNDVALVIVGSKWYGENKADEYTESLKALAKTLKGPIVFTGFVPPSEIAGYYNLGDVFICASQWQEPLARVHYEAMAAGLPIITTNRGGNAEVVNREYGNGIVIDDYSNPNVFAEKINYLLDNSDEAIELGKTGRNLAVKKYGWERVANDLLRLFESITINRA
ncbi:MAG: glycosyl transferase family 1 [Clostridiales bacterium GWB2_37_7]|nr:MAG: glycosyl transferase family 1 [Clostridiales bacterium GWB2_37_7]